MELFLAVLDDPPLPIFGGSPRPEGVPFAADVEPPTEDSKLWKPAPRGKRYEIMDNLVTGLLVRVSTGALGKTTKSFLVRSRVPGNADFSKRKATTDPSRLNPTRRSLGLVGWLTVEQARAAARRQFELITQGHDPRQIELAEQAEREAAERRQIKFSEVLEAWIDIRVSNFRRKRHTTQEARNMLLPVLRDKPLGSITPNECRSLILDVAARSRFQAKAATRILKTVFTWAIESGRYGIEVSPCDRIKFSKLVGTLPHRQRTLTDSRTLGLMAGYGEIIRFRARLFPRVAHDWSKTRRSLRNAAP